MSTADAARRAIVRSLEGVPDDPLPAMLYLDGKLGLVDDMLHYFDRASMAHSLEVRVPFLDHQLVEFCATIPADLKVRRLTTKYLLREAARGLVPERVLDEEKDRFLQPRRSKAGSRLRRKAWSVNTSSMLRRDTASFSTAIASSGSCAGRRRETGVTAACFSRS